MAAATYRLHLRLNERDHRIIAAVASKHGISDTGVVRMALSALARQEGISMDSSIVECESCAHSGQYGVPATTHSINPNWSGYNLCDECAAEYDSRMPEPLFSGDDEPTIECAYCGREVPGTGEEQTPAVDDDDAWAQLARYHYPDCEWIITRAHRVNI
jgi:hypothetical protein